MNGLANRGHFIQSCKTENDRQDTEEEVCRRHACRVLWHRMIQTFQFMKEITGAGTMVPLPTRTDVFRVKICYWLKLLICQGGCVHFPMGTRISIILGNPYPAELCAETEKPASLGWTCLCLWAYAGFIFSTEMMGNLFLNTLSTDQFSWLSTFD